MREPTRLELYRGGYQTYADLYDETDSEHYPQEDEDEEDEQ